MLKYDTYLTEARISQRNLEKAIDRQEVRKNRHDHDGLLQGTVI